MTAIMTEQMIHTLLALLTAHLMADFVVQTKAIVDHKKRVRVLLWHVSHVFVLSVFFLGGHLLLAFGVAAAHFVIDAVKVHLLPDRLWTYLGDQGAHLVTIAVAVWIVPDAVATGLWPALPATVPAALTVLCGLIVATRAGAPLLQLLMAPHRAAAASDGLDNAGRIIGLMERTLIFLMVMIGEPTGIGFLIAAKSILRFSTASNNQKVSEYIIIGTLASFGWALSIAFLTVAALRVLPT